MVKADLLSIDDISNLVNETCKKFICIINNAGIAESANITLGINEWSDLFDKTMSINLKAPALLIKQFIYLKRIKRTIQGYV